MLTIKTLRRMNAEHLAAFWANPPFFFVSDEMPYPEFSDVLKIVDHAHAVLGPIPLVQMVQPNTREAVTIEAVLDFGIRYLLTVFNSTNDAGFRFEAVVASATWAWFLISCECTAKKAIHSAGSDQLRGNYGYLCRFYRHHVRIPAKVCMGDSI
ncbi:MAG: hypothetical protein WBN94_01385 [Methanothrix sp.]